MMLDDLDDLNRVRGTREDGEVEHEHHRPVALEHRVPARGHRLGDAPVSRRPRCARRRRCAAPAGTGAAPPGGRGQSTCERSVPLQKPDVSRKFELMRVLFVRRRPGSTGADASDRSGRCGRRRGGRRACPRRRAARATSAGPPSRPCVRPRSTRAPETAARRSVAGPDRAPGARSARQVARPRRSTAGARGVACATSRRRIDSASSSCAVAGIVSLIRQAARSGQGVKPAGSGASFQRRTS